MKIERYLDQSPIFAAQVTAETIVRDLNVRLGADDLNFLQALILVAIFFENPKPISPSTLSKVLHTTAGNVSHCLTHLESRKMIRRTLDGVDARKYQISIRPEGKKTAVKLIKVFDASQSRIEKSLSIASVQKVVYSLSEIRQAYFGPTEKR